LSANSTLNIEKERSTSTEFIGAYLMYAKSPRLKFSGILTIEVSSPDKIFENLANVW